LLQVKVELPGLGLHILFRLRDCEGLPKRRVVGILLAPAEIVGNAALKELCLLWDYSYPLPPFLESSRRVTLMIEG